jgi:hypothetical protein
MMRVKAIRPEGRIEIALRRAPAGRGDCLQLDDVIQWHCDVVDWQSMNTCGTRSGSRKGGP